MSKVWVCVICGAEKKGGPRRGDYADRYEPCAQCRKKHLSSGVLLIEAVEDLVHPKNGPQLTGGVLVLMDDAFRELFDMPIPPRKIALIEPGLIQFIADEHAIGHPGKSEVKMSTKTQKDWDRELREAKALDDARYGDMSDEEYRAYLGEILGESAPPNRKGVRQACRKKLGGRRQLN